MLTVLKYNNVCASKCVYVYGYVENDMSTSTYVYDIVLSLISMTSILVSLYAFNKGIFFKASSSFC